MYNPEQKQDLLLFYKIKKIPAVFMFFSMAIFFCGVLILFSASKGNFYPWAYKHLLNFILALPIFFIIILTDIRVWFKLTYFLYAAGLLLLIAVKFMGVEGGLGAQRWLAIGGFRFQPSELVKVFLVLALARYYHNLHLNHLHKLYSLFVPLALIGIDAALVLIQPNLGTAAIICLVGGTIFFTTGISYKKIIFVVIVIGCTLPVLWANMHEYQKRRVHTFLNPESDPLGAGYNIIQSKIAIGSGGITGKGFLKGSQSQLNFVPEQQTDFIFSIVAEEFGLIGGLVVIILFSGLIWQALKISNNCKTIYARVTSYGMVSILFVHVFVNIGMVTGILPVVGVPLPLISYGGSSLISSMVAIAFVVNCHIHKDLEIITEDDEEEF
ncbi:MAG TPA: rod shape-determining protein RodA [Alphaproteobacteria bacterium]|nr:rod shape-determining protein RodA [Alphaproteobacteria bacterium]